MASVNTLHRMLKTCCVSILGDEKNAGLLDASEKELNLFCMTVVSQCSDTTHWEELYR